VIAALRRMKRSRRFNPYLIIVGDRSNETTPLPVNQPMTALKSCASLTEKAGWLALNQADPDRHRERQFWGMKTSSRRQG
jgi:hypothetical protein